MFVSSGTIALPSKDQKEGWFYVKADNSIGEYYRWLYSRAFQSWQNPMNGCHITFISGEKDDRIVSLSEISSYIGKEISFSYENKIWTNGRAFWLSVYSEKLDDIRLSLGLQPRKLMYHLTLGNIKNIVG